MKKIILLLAATTLIAACDKHDEEPLTKAAEEVMNTRSLVANETLTEIKISLPKGAGEVAIGFTSYRLDDWVEDKYYQDSLRGIQSLSLLLPLEKGREYNVETICIHKDNNAAFSSSMTIIGASEEKFEVKDFTPISWKEPIEGGWYSSGFLPIWSNYHWYDFKGNPISPPSWM